MMKKVIGFIVGIVMPLLSMAHGYWLEIKGSGKVGEPVTIRLCHGEIDDYSRRVQEPDTARFMLMAFGPGINAAAQSLEFKQQKDCWEATFTPTVAGSFQFLAWQNALPVVDRSGSGGKNVKPVETLSVQYQAGKNDVMEIRNETFAVRMEKEGGLTRIFPVIGGKVVPKGTKIRIFNPENWEKNLVTDEKGSAVFYPEKEGLYIIRIDEVDPTPGSYQGVSYVEVRKRYNYSYYKKRG